MVEPLKIYIDGASRGNPGPASCAYLIQKDGKIIKKEARFLGKKTNNEAEYHGIIMALTRAKKYTNDIVYLHSDSQLAIRQLKGEYKVRAANLRMLFNRVKNLLENFENYKLFHLNRDDEFIKICDKMCNDTLDSQGF
ncbi:MAG: reverse transcriptase-like protein [Candidatus Lokiarchaeota archaeon]|nr:reverse transcriptase-like protein [Candidatus Lokiarchaeota archaeon]MBD3202099.1 reverse transcriptase-like protein [Candidatus Lokiarchaeota archaeon]